MNKKSATTDSIVMDRHNVFKAMIIGTVVSIGLAVLYFLLFMVYLGGWGQTPHRDFVKQFGDRIEIEYEGTRLPEQDLQ